MNVQPWIQSLSTSAICFQHLDKLCMLLQKKSKLSTTLLGRDVRWTDGCDMWFDTSHLKSNTISGSFGSLSNSQYEQSGAQCSERRIDIVERIINLFLVSRIIIIRLDFSITEAEQSSRVLLMKMIENFQMAINANSKHCKFQQITWWNWRYRNKFITGGRRIHFHDRSVGLLRVGTFIGH